MNKIKKNPELVEFLKSLNADHFYDWFCFVATDKDLKKSQRNKLIKEQVGKLGLSKILSILKIDYK